MSINARNQGPSRLQRTSDELVSGAAFGTGASAASAAAELPEIDPSPTGVVFVHGIGEPVRAEILLVCSRPIVRAVAYWASSRPTDPYGQRWCASDRVSRPT